MAQWKLKTKVIILSSLLLLLFALTIFSSMKIILNQSFKRIISTGHHNYMEIKKEYLKDLVMMSHQIVAKHFATDSGEDSKEIVKKLLTDIRYQDGLGYFFAYEKREDGYYYVFHGSKSELVGKKAETDYDYRQKLIEKANEGGGWVEYNYEKPGQQQKVKKIAYAKSFTAWNWVLMAGLYVDDVENNINEIIRYDEKEKKYLTYTFLGITVFLLIFSILFIWFVVGKSVSSIIGELLRETEFLAKSADRGDLKTRGDITHIHEEFRPVVEGMNKMLDSFLSPVDEAISVLRKLELGNMSVKMEGEFKGDYALLKTTLNQTIDSMSDLLFQAKIIVKQLGSSAQAIVRSGHFLCETSFNLKKVLKDFDHSAQNISCEIEKLSSELIKFLNGDKHDKNDKNGEKLLEIIKHIDDLSKKMLLPLNTLSLLGERGIISSENYSEMADILADQARQLEIVIEKFKLEIV